MASALSDWLVPGDYCTTPDGTVYKVVKVNRVNTVIASQDGKMYNFKGTLKKTEDQGWVSVNDDLQVGQVFRVKSTSGLWKRTWFTRFAKDQLFIITKADAAQINFIPVGGTPMPANLRGYVGSASDVVRMTVTNIEVEAG